MKIHSPSILILFNNWPIEILVIRPIPSPTTILIIHLPPYKIIQAKKNNMILHKNSLKDKRDKKMFYKHFAKVFLTLKRGLLKVIRNKKEMSWVLINCYYRIVNLKSNKSKYKKRSINLNLHLMIMLKHWTLKPLPP